MDIGERGANVLGRVDVFKGVRVDLEIFDDVFFVKWQSVHDMVKSQVSNVVVDDEVDLDLHEFKFCFK